MPCEGVLVYVSRWAHVWMHVCLNGNGDGGGGGDDKSRKKNLLKVSIQKKFE